MNIGIRRPREARNAIASCRPFENWSGSFHGTRGPTRELGLLEEHTDAPRIRELLSQAVYVVWSYDTPVGFVSEDEDGNRTAYYVDVDYYYTMSTLHQSTTRWGLGEYETIGAESPWELENRRRTAEQRRVGTLRSRTHDSAFPNGMDEYAQADRLAILLDSNYRNPDWVPGRDYEADRAAELRDVERVEREGRVNL